MFARRNNNLQGLGESSLPLLTQYLAKTRKNSDNTVLPGRQVFNHCQIVGEVARAMIKRMPQWMRHTWTPTFAKLSIHDFD